MPCKLQLIVCNQVGSHHYSQNYGKCYWCERKAQLGVDIFPGVSGTATSAVKTATTPSTTRQYVTHVTPSTSSNQTTKASAPAPTQSFTPLTLSNQTTKASASASSGKLKDWQKSTITGTVIGCFVLIGLILTRPQTPPYLGGYSRAIKTPKQPNSKVSTISSLSQAKSPAFQKQQKDLTFPRPQIAIPNAIPGWNKNLMVDNVPYELYIPPHYSNAPLLPCILVLPGWNFPRTSWVENTSLVEYAEQYGYALILPEMGKTLYESSYYPQTRMKWNQVPGGQFIKDRFIPTIQRRHNLLQPGQYNTILGLSTGGRGVALIALQNPGLFVAGASLSGDFSQEHMPEDRLMTAVYGAFANFPKRWTGTRSDNPQAQVRNWQMPLYLAHGTADNIVPESQSRLFYEALKKAHGNMIPIEYHAVTGAGHNYQFWGGQLKDVFRFFNEIGAWSFD